MKEICFDKFCRSIMLLGFCFTILFSSCNSNGVNSSTAAGDSSTVKKSEDSNQISLKVQQLTGGLEGPTTLTFPGNGDIWVTEQKGKIRVIRNGKLMDTVYLASQVKF